MLWGRSSSVVNVDVVNQYKDHTMKNPTSMSVQKPVTQRRSLIIARRLSIRPETHIRKTTAMLADRNGKLDNFARTARASEDHKMQFRNTSGLFNQRLNVKRAAQKTGCTSHISRSQTRMRENRW
jgi:hypothetical protein